MEDELDKRGVKLICMTPEQPETIQKFRGLHGCKAQFLSDPGLKHTDRLNLRNQVNITPTGVRPLPIPTTIFVDGEGVVRWLDQAKDYQVRAHPDRIFGMLDEHLPPKA